MHCPSLFLWHYSGIIIGIAIDKHPKKKKMKNSTLTANIKWTSTRSFTVKNSFTPKSLNTTTYTRTGKGFLVKLQPISQ